MKKVYLFALALFLFLPSIVLGAPLQLAPDLQVAFELPSARWQSADAPPNFLVRMMAKNAEPAMLERAASKGLGAEDAMRQMLGTNEHFVFNPDTESYLLIDFSPLRSGEDAPSKKTIKNSAEYAGAALEAEEGLSEVRYSTDRFKVEGAKYSYRVQASYERDGEKLKFTGVIGYVPGGWFFLYYTDMLKDSADASEMETLLSNLKFIGAAN